jgi:hypothetical protein
MPQDENFFICDAEAVYHPRNYGWAELMKRVFDFDVYAYWGHKCGPDYEGNVLKWPLF